MPRCKVFLVFTLLNVLWAFGPVVWCLPLENLEKNLYYSTNSSVLFSLLFPVFPLLFYNFCNCPMILEHSIPLLSLFSLSAFQFWKCPLLYLKTLWFSSWPCLVYSWPHQRHSSFWFNSVFDLTFSFDSFVRVFNSQLMLLTCSLMFSAFSMNPLAYGLLLF